MYLFYAKKYGGQEGRGPWILIYLTFKAFHKRKKNCYATLFLAWFYFKTKWDDETYYANDVNKNFLQERRWFCLKLNKFNISPIFLKKEQNFGCFLKKYSNNSKLHP